MSYSLYILFGVLPSIIWLLFYLKKDVHPEPKLEVLKIFFCGALATIPAFFLEKGVFATTASSLFSGELKPAFITILNAFLGVALVEEVLKYLVVREKVLRSPEFDEPIDAMLYMIIAALGFAALENILLFFRLGPEFLVKEALALSIFRFLGATFLHTLCSGTVGFFLALSFSNLKNNFWLISVGIGTASLLHGLYNFSIMEIEGSPKTLIPIIILIGLAIFVSLAFKRLKKMKSICKIQ